MSSYELWYRRRANRRAWSAPVQPYSTVCAIIEIYTLYPSSRALTATLSSCTTFRYAMVSRSSCISPPLAEDHLFLHLERVLSQRTKRPYSTADAPLNFLFSSAADLHQLLKAILHCIVNVHSTSSQIFDFLQDMPHLIFCSARQHVCMTCLRPFH